MPTFVLERFHWRRAGPAGWVRLPGETPVAAFADAADAHAECARREAAARAVVGHPCRCGTTLGELTTLPDFAFQDWLRDADIDPPDPDPDGRWPLATWADLYRGEWSDAQLARLWEGANRVRFFRVRERGEVLHCVVRVRWAQAMSYTAFLPESEGGTPTAVWHDRPAADRDRDAKQLLAADEVAAAVATTGEGNMPFDPHRRNADPFADTPKPAPTDAPAAVHCEVLEVERGEPDPEPLADTAFVVVAVGWEPLTDDAEEEVPGLFDRHREAGGVPVRVFARKEDAERYATEREAEFRAFANPYRFRPAAVQGGNWHDLNAARALAELGIHPPPPAIDAYEYYPTRAAFADWWARVADRLTPMQRAGVWEHTWEYGEPLRLFEVRAVRVGDAGGVRRRTVRSMYYVRATEWVPAGGPGMNPLRFLGAFADRRRAEAVREDAEEKFRDSPPDGCGPPMAWEENRPWEELTSMTQAQMRDHLLAHGITAAANPNFYPDPYWWEQNRRTLHPRQVRAVWAVFDRVRLYEVLALPTEVSE